MKISLGIVFILMAQWATAQLRLQPINSNQDNYLEARRNASSSEIAKNTLPFWDDFSITEDGAPDALRVWGNDTTRQWDLANSRGVFVNSTLAVNPPSYRVVTFDGLDGNGLFYTNDDQYSDELVSDTMALGSFNNADEVYMSFYWQAGGNVEAPDEGDSLTLEFYDKTISGFRIVWSVDGSTDLETTIFYQDTVRLTERYLSDTAIFRFRSYSDRNGPFDAWHLDWIYINADRGADDFFYEDVSINTDPSGLFSPFKSMPTAQIEISTLSAEIRATAMSLNNEVNDPTSPEPDDTVGLNLPYTTEIIDVELSEVIASDVFTLDLLADRRRFLNIDPFVVDGEGNLNFESLSLSSLTLRDSIVLDYTMFVDTIDSDRSRFLDGSQIDLSVNDTISTQTLLQDFYAYDDGTAEYVVGTNVVGGQVAVQYWVQTPDTLTHVDFYFPNIEPTSNGSVLTLRVFQDLNENPLRSQTITVNTADSINQFERYRFEIENDSGELIPRPVVVSDTFFIAYEQNVSNYIGIGFDRSNFEASPYIFENIDNLWVRNERLQGAMMIRPVFQSGSELVLHAERPTPEIMVFPNPTDGTFKIAGNYEKIEVINVLGQKIATREKAAVHNFDSLEPGLYFLRIYSDAGMVVKKLIKR